MDYIIGEEVNFSVRNVCLRVTTNCLQQKIGRVIFEL